jgi:hypothetical protein
MAREWRGVVCAGLVLGITLAHAAPRSAAERLAFKPCPGYVIDHVQPLCAGGPDRRENMQWQAAAEARIKDRWERRICRRHHGDE